MDFVKNIQLILDNPANHLTTTSRDLLETMQITFELQESETGKGINGRKLCETCGLDKQRIASCTKCDIYEPTMDDVIQECQTCDADISKLGFCPKCDTSAESY